MSASSYTAEGTGSGAIATSLTVPVGQTYKLLHVTLNLNVAATTSEYFTITWNKEAGLAYDVRLYTNDLATTGTTDLVWYPEKETKLKGGDAVDVAWFNTESRTYGVEITAERA